ncbi:MAG: sigma-54-dependent Fis family transcriptional regulator [Deltaproteobacteria bacterium]|nr:sigma-54-dependent Fis family transcriptional regulator [Deltaproteobacteria bacterium]
MHTILVVDDHELIRETLKKALVDEGYHVKLAHNGAACLEIVESRHIDLILLDMRLPDMNGLDVLRRIKNANPDIIVIVMTAYGDLDSSHYAMSLGAFDFIHKPVKARAMTSIIKMAMEIRSLRMEMRQIIYKNKEKYGYHNIIGKSEAIQKVMVTLTRVATSDASTILIEGASGTGKSLIAKCLHYNGLRAYQPFVEINCASIPPTLMESELFGHEAGAFTDAKKQKKGLVELAHGGTLFLDEIGEMSTGLQAKLLQVIEDKVFRRVGGTLNMDVDIRIIAATNRNLKQAVEKQIFRQDLYYRLNVINIYLPSLKERKEDIMPLVEHFISYQSREFRKPIKRVSDNARDMLLRYDWPGNVRELLNTIERIMILEDGDVILPENLPVEIIKGKEPTQHDSAVLITELTNMMDGSNYEELTQNFQSILIKTALELSRGNKTEAAKILGLTRLGLHYQLKKLGMSPKDNR